MWNPSLKQNKLHDNSNNLQTREQLKSLAGDNIKTLIQKKDQENKMAI